MHGHGKEALKHFEQMCEEGVQPNDITFVCLLLACSHVLSCFNGHRLYNSCKIGTLHLYGRPSWPCWQSTGGRDMVMAMSCKLDVAS
jgi:hypothetical protein